MVMNLFEQIKRIKVIMFEQVEDYEIMTFGDMNSELGMRVCIKKPNGEHIGKTNIIDYENALILSPNLTSFIENKNDLFNQENSVYQYGLEIEEPYRGQGWGEKLKNECHNIIKNCDYSYGLNIVKCDNLASQKLMEKLGYQKHQTNGERDLLYYVF
jgi:ribosomal protein S18 acetylase RimI-like enzyme